MAFFDEDEIHDLYVESKHEGDIWREDYHEYERLADNDLMEDLDEDLPEVNDGSLAASLFKLPKRIVSRKLIGHANATDADEAWITELANLQWEKKIMPNAKSQASAPRKWKDAVRKSAIYGGQPIITLFVERGNYTGADFIVPQAQDVTLEAGKVSDEDSDIIFWDVYYSKKQVRDMIEQAESETEDNDGYNVWDIPALKEILAAKMEEDRDSREDHNKKLDKGVKKSGFHFYIAFQRGVEAPFYMCHATGAGDDLKKSTVRKWSNPDPTGDVPVHYLYCYQDFINPYGTGIVKLAGGTQNVLDFFRQSDVLATEIGIMPPKKIMGDEDDVDIQSMVYAKNANWFTGSTEVDVVEMSNKIYEQLPNRIAMYKTSLNQIIPTGDTSIGSQSGDPQYSRTPAGVKFQAANLSIDDEDFKDNLYLTYAAVAKSMINTHFANMQGTDLMKLSDEERDLLMKAGLPFPMDDQGNPTTNELDIIWDETRAKFDYEMDPEQDKAKDDASRLDGLLKIIDFVKDPNTQALITSGKPIILGKKKLDVGELMSEVVALTSDNDKILEDVTPDEVAALEQSQQQATQESSQVQPSQSMSYKDAPEDIKRQMEGREGYEPSQTVSPVQQELDQKAQDQATKAKQVQQQATAAPSKTTQKKPTTPPAQDTSTQEIMQKYGVDENTAKAMLAAEQQGFSPEEILAAVQRQGAQNG